MPRKIKRQNFINRRLMDELLDYIDRYFRGGLPEAEKVVFEKRCETDLPFAETVSFYLAARQTARQELQEQKKKEFGKLYQALSATTHRAPSRIRQLRPWLAAAAAAIVLAFLAWTFFIDRASPQQLATRYIDKDLRSLSVTMGGKRDSLQQGIAAFNVPDYPTAEKIFLALTRQENPGPDAFKYLGITYLVNNQYDQAIQQFDRLSAYPDLYANPGPFYKAITLMKRSTGDDRLKAKQLLQEIIDQKLPGNREAAGWISHF